MLFPITNTTFETMDHSESKLDECAILKKHFFFHGTSLAMKDKLLSFSQTSLNESH